MDITNFTNQFAEDINKFTVSLYLLIIKTRFRIKTSNRNSHTYINDIKFLLCLKEIIKDNSCPGLFLFNDKFKALTDFFSELDFDDKKTLAQSIASIKHHENLKLSNIEKRFYLDSLDSELKDDITSRIWERNRWSVLVLFISLVLLIFSIPIVSSKVFSIALLLKLLPLLIIFIFSFLDAALNLLGLHMVKRKSIPTCMFNILFNTKECKKICSLSKDRISKELDETKINENLDSSEKRVESKLKDFTIIENFKNNFKEKENDFYSLIELIPGEKNKDLLEQMNNNLYLRVVFCNMLNLLKYSKDNNRSPSYADLKRFFIITLDKVEFVRKGTTAFANILYAYDQKLKKQKIETFKGNPILGAFNKNSNKNVSIKELKNEELKKILEDNDYLAEYYLESSNGK